MTVKEKQEELIEAFSLFDDWMDKYSYIIDLGKALEPMEAEHKTDENFIKGCQSQVWIYMEEKDGKLFLKGDSDAILVKGIVALVLAIFSGQKVEDIVDSELFFVSHIGLDEHLSMNRSNGLRAMIEQIRYRAKQNIKL